MISLGVHEVEAGSASSASSASSSDEGAFYSKKNTEHNGLPPRDEYTSDDSSQFSDEHDDQPYSVESTTEDSSSRLSWGRDSISRRSPYGSPTRLFHGLFDTGERAIRSNEGKSDKTLMLAVAPRKPPSTPPPLTKSVGNHQHSPIKEKTERGRKKAKTQKIVKEFVESEGKYCGFLLALEYVFLHPMEVDSLALGVSKDDLENIFSNAVNVQSLHAQMREEVEGAATSVDVATVLLKYAEDFHVYYPYASSMKVSQRTVSRLVTGSSSSIFGAEQVSAFSLFLDKQTNSSRNKCFSGGQSLSSCLIAPIQRVPRYELLLKELIKHQDDNDTHTNSLLQRALISVQNIAQTMNCRIGRSDVVLGLQDTVCMQPVPLSIWATHRSLLHSERISIIHKKHYLCGLYTREIQKACVFYVLTDLLVWTDEHNVFKGWAGIGDGVNLVDRKHSILGRGIRSTDSAGDERLQADLTLNFHTRPTTLRLMWESENSKIQWIKMLQRQIKIHTCMHASDYCACKYKRRSADI